MSRVDQRCCAGSGPGAEELAGTEVHNAAGGDIVALDDYQLASRLSYLLWATTPDAELSKLADAGTLHDPAVLAEQARRLLRDPRSRALFDGFGAQWLGLDKLAGKTFDAQKFPQMNADLDSLTAQLKAAIEQALNGNGQPPGHADEHEESD